MSKPDLYPLFTFAWHNRPMNEGKIQEHVNWFSFSLAAQRNNLTQLFARLRSIGAKVGTSMAVHHKFIRLMDQVADAQKKELDLLCDIEEMEKRHAVMREQRLLRQANDNLLKPKADPDYDLGRHDTRDEKPARGGLGKLLLLLALFAPKPNKHDNQ